MTREIQGKTDVRDISIGKRTQNVISKETKRLPYYQIHISYLVSRDQLNNQLNKSDEKSQGEISIKR